MPGEDAKIGDAYWVHREATEHPVRVGRAARRWPALPSDSPTLSRGQHCHGCPRGSRKVTCPARTCHRSIASDSTVKVHGLYAGSTLVPGDEPEVQRVLRARRIARHITKLGLAFRAEETPNWSEMLDLTKSLETILRREIALAEQDEQAEPS